MQSSRPDTLLSPMRSMVDSYSPQRRVPSFQRARRAAAGPLIEKDCEHAAATPTDATLLPPPSQRKTNRTRDWMQQSALLGKEAARLLSPPLNGKSANRRTPDAPLHPTPGFFSPPPQAMSAHTPLTTFTSSVHSSFASTPGSAASSHSAGSQFTSPLQPHHLSFGSPADSILSSTPVTASLLHSKSASLSSSPITPLSFDSGAHSPLSVTGSGLFPPLRNNYTAAPRHVLPRKLAQLQDSPDEPSSLNSSLGRSSSAYSTMSELSFSSHVSSSAVDIATPFTVRVEADSPVLSAMDMGTTPPPAMSLSSNPFVSPVPIRCVALNGALKTQPGGGNLLPRTILPHSPSPIAFSLVKPGSRAAVAPMGLMGPPKGHGHTRSASNGSVDAGSASRRSRVPLLNAKRTRGSSMDLEAERESGAEPIEHAFSMDPECLATAITHSMRKLKVKKSADASPGPHFSTERRQRQARRNSGFSSSDDESPTTSSSVNALTQSAAPASQNMKLLRRQRQMQSVQKKRDLLDGEEEEQEHSSQASLVAALNHAAVNSAGFAPATPLSMRKGGTGLGSHLQVTIPFGSSAEPRFIQPVPSAAAMCLDSPPAVHAPSRGEMLGSRLTYSSDEDEDLSAVPSFVLPASTPFKPLPSFDADLVDEVSPSSGTRPIATALDFGAVSDEEEGEKRDTMGVLRGSSFSADALGMSFASAFGASSTQSTPQATTRQLYSPVPQHTPLTPAPATSAPFSFQVPVATPLPVLPSMAPPASSMRSGSDSAAPTPVPSELDFLSPVASNHSPPQMSPNSSGFQLEALPDGVRLSPLPVMEGADSAHNQPFVPLLRNLSDDRLSRFSQQQSYDDSQQSTDVECTPPTSPRPNMGGFLSAPSNMMFALSPDPKAFADSTSLVSVRRTPARGKLQPPPTPLRPSSIKRSHAPHIVATPSKPSQRSMLSSSSSSGMGTPPSASSSTLPVFAPLHNVPLRLGRLERTSSLYDSKVLIDFKAHILAAAAAKQKMREAAAAAGGTVPEDLDASMNSDDDELLLSVATPPPASVVGAPCNGSIWETSFTSKALVGAGSFFQTYRCQSCDRVNHPDEHGQFFAVKKSLREFRGKKDRSIYLREVAVMESIEHHENIVKHIRAWQEDLHFFIQMEYCPMNLSEYIVSLQQAAVSATSSTGGALSPTSNPYSLSDALLKNITLQLASALHHIHSRDLVHLDVKPDNVLISFDGILKLADFGQARSLKHAEGDANSWDMDGVEGDSVFMAPELLGGEGGPTPAADIFSLGLLLVELASGVQLPQSGEVWHDLRAGRAHKHVHGRVSETLEHVILNLLEPKPQKRPTALQIIQWLEANHE